MDDYVECAECGHPLERHDLRGCDQQVEGCTCTRRWTVRQIQAIRREEGLPGHFNPWEY